MKPETTIRPYTPEDIPSMHNVAIRAAEHDSVDPLSTLESMPSLEQIVESLESNNTDPNSDVFVAVDEKTKDIVGYGKIGWWQEEDGTFVYIHQGQVDPKHRGHGVGQELLQTLQSRIREVANGHPEDKPKTFGANASESEEGALKLLEKDGYKKVWSQVEMEFTDFDDLNAVEQPEGFEFRAPTTVEERRKGYELNVRVYEGRPGAVPASEEGFQEFLEENADLSLWKVAWDGDNIAGFVLGRSDKDKGEVTEVATAPEYRHRCLGKWLMTENIKALHEQGNEIIRLHTNSDGAQGGRQLYDSMGFSALKESHRLRKPLRESKINPEEVEADTIDANESWQAVEQQLPHIKDVEGGFSKAQRGLVTLPDGKEVFVKVGTAENTRIWARKEVAVYKALEAHGFEHSPRLIAANADGSAFALEAFSPEDGWDWQDNWTAERLAATLKAMDDLAAIELSDAERTIFIKSSISQDEDGWRPLLESPEMQEILRHKLHGVGADDIAQSIDFTADTDKASRYDFADDALVHYDLRADNCAWNAETGQVRLVDWNWAQFGDRDIDLAATLTHVQKSGFDIPVELIEKVNPDAFHWMAGFWLNAAATPIWEGGSESLRDLQLLSGITALRLAKAKQ